MTYPPLYQRSTLGPQSKSTAGPWGWAVGIVAALTLGWLAGFVTPGPQLNATTPTPIATATTVVEVTRTASPDPSQSRNVQALKWAWGDISEEEKAGIREGWRAAKANGLEDAAITMAMEKLAIGNLRNLTKAEVREFLNWTLEN